MAVYRPDISNKAKKRLLSEAGQKCANPGCANRRTHNHHIREWAVYQTHDEQHMIAICPSCHDAAHHGRLKITEEVLYRWKGIKRPGVPDSAHIYVEPASELKLLTGSLCISTTNDQVTVFQLSNTNHLKLRVLDNDILQVSVLLKDQRGNKLLSVVENNVRVVRDKEIEFDYRAGRARITVPATNDFAPRWLIDQVRVEDPTFAADGRIVALDIEVLKPGLLRVQGCWPDGNFGVVMTEKALYFCRRAFQGPLPIIGLGENTGFHYTGPITSAIFSFLGVDP